MLWNNNVNMDLFNAPTPFGDEVQRLEDCRKD